jgi:5'-methylthioadenosine phosphorylase
LETATKFSVIGGSGFEQLFQNTKPIQVETPYGLASTLSIGKVDDHHVVFLSRHGSNHSIPPHRINYKANIWALNDLGVERIIALNAVGAINSGFKPCDIVLPHDFIDFTKSRPSTFYDKAPVTHVDMSVPYCPEINSVLIESLKHTDLRVHKKAVLACAEGPRYETPAETEMFRRLGADIVSMTGIPEAVLARELEICYVPLCFVSNMAAGLQDKLTPLASSEMSQIISFRLGQALIEALKNLPSARKDCPCSKALKDARFQ